MTASFLKALAALCCIGFIVPQCAHGKVYHVSNGERISPVLDRAQPADTVVIHEGEFLETLIIDKPLFLIGQGLPQIRGSYTSHVILVQAPGTVLDGLKISEAGTRLIDDMACIRVEADSVTIRNNVITEPLHGIYVKGGSEIVIHDNYIEGRTDLIPADRGNGIHLWNSRRNFIYNNEITNVRDGIYFSFADSTEIHQNHIHHVRYGLHYMYSDDNKFTANLFENNVAGAALMYSKNIIFDGNVFARCRGFRAYGILYKVMDNTVAVNNLIIDNSRGVFMDNGNFNRFENNDIVDNDLAFQVIGSGEDNVIVNNNVVNNLSDLLVDNKNTQIVWNTKSGGNYWSGYRGYDLDGDGLGDVPHKIQNAFQIIETNIPEVRFYRFSPAAEILEIAERALPILRLGTDKDVLPRFRPRGASNIPWSRVRDIETGASPAFAAIFFGLLVFPFYFLLYINPRRRK